MLSKNFIPNYKLIVTLIVFALLGSACSLTSGQKPTSTLVAIITEPPSSPEATPTPSIPTPTTEPMAALVNGEGITQASFDLQLKQLQSAQSDLKIEEDLATQKQRVLDSMISEVLLAQAAAENGYKISDDTIQQHIDAIKNQLQDGTSLADWETSQGYTDETFRVALGLSLAAAWERDQILAQVPDTAEQIHARQILVYNSDKADNLYHQLELGADFATIAYQIDPTTGGDLGWFPQGYLLESAISDEVWKLTPGEYTQVIQTRLGYHIVQVIAKEDHPLSPDAHQSLEQQTLQDWLKSRRDQSDIKILVQ